MIELLIAFGAGLISFLSPCVLPLIPGYISYISGASLDELLANKKINIQVISTSEIKISVLIDKKNTKKALIALHKEFKLDN